jgi:hypothetical protein
VQGSRLARFMKLHGVDSTFDTTKSSAHHISTPHHVHTSRRRPNLKHVETLNTSRRGAGGPVTANTRLSIAYCTIAVLLMLDITRL